MYWFKKRVDNMYYFTKRCVALRRVLLATTILTACQFKTSLISHNYIDCLTLKDEPH